MVYVCNFREVETLKIQLIHSVQLLPMSSIFNLVIELTSYEPGAVTATDLHLHQMLLCLQLFAFLLME